MSKLTAGEAIPLFAGERSTGRAGVRSRFGSFLNLNQELGVWSRGTRIKLFLANLPPGKQGRRGRKTGFQWRLLKYPIPHQQLTTNH